MAKEELKQEAYRFIDERFKHEVLGMRVQGLFTYWELLNSVVDFAEPRKKRIEELLALINAERKRQEECDNVHLRKISDLEKENAELKRDRDLAVRYYHEQTFDLEVTKDNLTKARKIIENLLQSQPTPSSMYEETDLIDWRESIKEAEQFLKEIKENE